MLKFEDLAIEDLEEDKLYDVTYCQGTPNEVTLHMRGSLIMAQIYYEKNELLKAVRLLMNTPAEHILNLGKLNPDEKGKPKEITGDSSF